MAERRTVATRLDDDLGGWLEAYASERGVKKSAVLEEAVRGLRERVRGGVPDLPTKVAVVTGVKLEPAVGMAKGKAGSAVKPKPPKPRSVDEVLKPMTEGELRAWKRAQTGGGSRGVA